MKNSKDYNRAYYLENKERISKKRKEAYRNSERVRGRVIKAAKLQQAFNRVTTGYFPVPGFYTIPKMAEYCNRHYLAVYSWYKNHMFPRPVKRDSHGRPLFTQHQVWYMKEVLTRVDSGRLLMTYGTFKRFLRIVWDKEFSLAQFNKALKEARK